MADLPEYASPDDHKHILAQMEKCFMAALPEYASPTTTEKQYHANLHGALYTHYCEPPIPSLTPSHLLTTTKVLRVPQP